MKPFIASVTTVALALLLVVGGAFGLAAFGDACAGDRIDQQQASRLPPVAGYSGDQLAYAAVILNAVTDSGVDARANLIAVLAATTRSGLRNLDTAPDLGLFGLPEQFGDPAERLNPTVATQRFLATLAASPTWVGASPAEAAAAAIPGTDPALYAPHIDAAAAITQALQATTGSCAVGDDPVALAQELIDAADVGLLRGLVPDHIKEIRWIAQGKTVPNCGIDVRILQIMVIAVRNFDSVTVSDINRLCTGQIAGAGTLSSHWLGGGGNAVDFAALDGQKLYGDDAASLRLISILEPVVPPGSRVGQSDCRAESGTTVATTNFTQFPDSCDHLHIDVQYAGEEPLAF